MSINIGQLNVGNGGLTCLNCTPHLEHIKTITPEGNQRVDIVVITPSNIRSLKNKSKACQQAQFRFNIKSLTS